MRPSTAIPAGGTSAGRDRVHAGAYQRSRDRTDAERSVEARHDRPFQLLLDRTAFHVHGDVPLTGAEPEDEQTGADQDCTDLGADGDDRESCDRHQRHDRDGAGGTESMDDESGRGQREQGADGGHQQQRAERTRLQVEQIADLRTRDNSDAIETPARMNTV